MGFEGVDLLIRPGYQLQPGDSKEKLVEAFLYIARRGLALPIVTTDFTHAGQEGAETVFAACGETGVPYLRLGWWKYRPEMTYRRILEQARRGLATLVKLGETYGVKPLLQLHGETIHPGAGLAAKLVEGFTPAEVGIYVDPGNMVNKDGYEDWTMGLDVIDGYLEVVGVKNADKIRKPAVQGPNKWEWERRWVPLDEGLVDWVFYLELLKKRGYRGWLSFHSHYETDLHTCTATTKHDLDFVRKLL